MRPAIVIVGCGWAGRIHARALASRDEIRIAAVVDGNAAAARALADELGVAAYTSLDEVFAAEVPFQAATVATPAETHFALCLQLAEAGKDVFCEKPLALNTAEAAALRSAADKHGVRIVPNYNQRFASPIQKLKEHLGTDPTVRHVNISMFQHPPQVLTATNPYFLITDACCHLIDTLLFLNGGMDEVYAYGADGPKGLLFDVAVSIRFTNGSVGVMSNTFWGGLHDSQHPFFHLQIVTEEARCVVENLYDGLSIFPHDGMYERRWTPSVFSPRSYDASMVASIHAWVDALRSGKPRGASLEEGVQNVQVVEAVVRSLESGRPVAVRTN